MEAEIRHLLGYLTPEQWADALYNAKDMRLDEATLKVALREIEETYGTKILEAVEEILKSKGGK